MIEMRILADFFLNFILLVVPGARLTPHSPSVSHDGGINPATPGKTESSLLHDVNLESRSHEAAHQASEKAAVEEPDAARPPDQGADPEIGLASPGQQLPTTANQATVARAEGERTLWASNIKDYLTVSLIISSMAIGILVDLLFIHPRKEPLRKNPSLIVAYISATVSFVSSAGLMWRTMKQMNSCSTMRCSWVNELFLFLSILSLGFALISLIVSFVPKSYYYLPIVLVPTLSVLGIYVYDIHPTDGDMILGNDDPHKSDKKRSFQLTINMTTFSFMGTLGTVIGYHKTTTDSANHSYVIVSIFFMLGAAIFGLVSLLVNRLLKRKDWTKIAVGNAIMLCLLVLAVLTVSATFLGGILAATLFPVPVAAAIFWFMEYYAVPHDGHVDLDMAFTQEDELKPLYTVALTTMSMSFGAVMTIFSGFLGGEAKGPHLKVCIFFVVTCFVSSVSLGVVTFRTPKKASCGAAARSLACLTFVLLVLAALALISYVGS